MVKAELGEAVWAEGEEDLLGPHHRAVSHLDICLCAFFWQGYLVSVRVPRGRRLLMWELHVDAAEGAPLVRNPINLESWSFKSNVTNVLDSKARKEKCTDQLLGMHVRFPHQLDRLVMDLPEQPTSLMIYASIASGIVSIQHGCRYCKIIG